MTILGIDPGQKESGWVRWEKDEQKVVAFGIWENGRLSEMLRMIRASLALELVAIEVIRGYGIVSGDDTFDTCIWIGRFDPLQTALLIPRKTIKKHLCGNVTTNDKYVRQSLIDRFGEPGTKKNPGPLFGITGHCWSALAVAVTAAEI